jgi:2-oxoglutarate/2-oxoacid ferredoxin oxidoreductase subunit alpha
MSWLYGRSTEITLDYLRTKFAKRPEIAEANIKAFNTGYHFGETSEGFAVQYEVKAAPLAPGLYRQITGNTALSWGLLAASKLSGLDLFLGAYPITPASSILEELAKHKAFGVRTFQAEDEIAAVGAALGASFGGALGVTTSAGPGVVLKSETVGLAIALELPLLVIDVQRAGPSTGMPTKTEAADLLMAIHGRHGESPLPVLAAATPADCFNVTLEAARIAITYRTPVIVLSDTFLANSSEPWKLPSAADLPEIDPNFAAGPNADGQFLPYLRDERFARPWALPGTPGLEHVVGGLEKEDGSGHISYDPANHARMTELRAAKIGAIAEGIPELEVDDPDGADLLVLGWGSSYGAILGAARRVRRRAGKVACAHLRNLNPLPRNTGDVLRAYPRVLVPEMNTGQLSKIVRAEFLVDAESYTKIEGLPLFAAELDEVIEARLP